MSPGTTPESRQRARDAAEKRGLDADRAAADADRTAADREQRIVGGMQAASDADRRSSEQDDADSNADQRAADQDQADQDQAGQQDEAGQDAQPSGIVRKTTARSRRATRDVRTETARLRETASGTESSPESVVEEVQSLAAGGRSRAASDRERSADDRRDAAETRARLEAELYAARLDSLTGAFGRDLGNTMLNNEIDRARRGEQRFVLAFVDIDDMKGLNDRDGHAAGDRALRSLVSIMRANLRSFDPVVRYGGDEFVCGMGGVDIAEVERRFEVIDSALRHDLGVSISVGVAELGADDSLDELTERADANLLVNKRARRRTGGRDGESPPVPVGD